MGTGIIVLMGLIPPWYYRTFYGVDQRIVSEMRAEENYGFLFSPPDPLYERGYSDRRLSMRLARIDFSRLILQWFVVAVSTAGIIFFLERSKK